MNKGYISAPLALALLTLLTLSGCTLKPESQAHHACFDPAPLPPVEILHQWRYQLRWATGHRGDRQAGPDNSLQAIVAAARHGAPLIEVDVRVSQDGSLFLFHDRRLRQHNYSGPIQYLDREFSSLTASEIRTLKHPGGSNETLTSYAAALSAVRGFPVALELDLKGESPQLAQRVIQIARESNQLDQIVIQCQLLETAQYIRANFPGVAILAITHNPGEIDIALNLSPVPEIVHIDFPIESHELVTKIHNAGSAVLMKSLDEGQDNKPYWTKLMDLGVDIVMTDRPQQFVRAIPRACPSQ